MSLPFFGANVVQVFKDDLPDVAASEAAYWTRLAVPDGLPIFAEDRAWAEAIMAHYNPVTQRCFVVALGTEDMIEPFLALYPDGIGSGGPNDQPWAVEINPHKELDLSVVEGAGLLVLNEMPLGRISDMETAKIYGDESGESDGPDMPDMPDLSSTASSESSEDAPGEYQGPDLGRSATAPLSGGSGSGHEPSTTSTKSPESISTTEDPSETP